MRPRSLKLTPSLDKALTSYATSRGTSASSVVREALEGYLGNSASGAERQPESFSARASDLAGCVNGPADLSTNSDRLAAYGTSTVRKARARLRRP